MDQGLKLSEPQVYELLWSFEARSKSAWVGVQMTPDPGRHCQLPICFPFPTLNCHWKPCFVYNDIIHNCGWGTINGSKPTMTILFPFSQPFHPGQWELNRKSTRHFWKIKMSFSDRDINGCHGSSLFFLLLNKGHKKWTCTSPCHVSERQSRELHVHRPLPHRHWTNTNKCLPQDLLLSRNYPIFKVHSTGHLPVYSQIYFTSFSVIDRR